MNNVIVFWFVWRLTGPLVWSGDQHQPQVRQGPYPVCGLYTAEGPLQGDNQVTAEHLPPQWSHVSLMISLHHPKLNLFTFGCIGKKTYVPQRKTKWVPPQLLLLVIISLRCHAQRTTFMLQVETYKSFRPGDIVLAKVVSFTCRLKHLKRFHCLWELPLSPFTLSKTGYLLHDYQVLISFKNTGDHRPEAVTLVEKQI